MSALQRSLRFNPSYGPAILSMGSVEYQRGRQAAGRRLFHSLLKLPKNTRDLLELIDKSGDFLIHLRAYKDGLELYRAAAAKFPAVAVFHQGVGCCAGNEGLHEEAVAASERALHLEPDNQKFVNDLGWSVLEAGRAAEAEKILKRAVSMDPSDSLAAENLRWCREKISNAKSQNETRSRTRRANSQ